MLRTLGLVVLVSVAIAGCTLPPPLPREAPAPIAAWQIVLSEVERPADATNRYGAYAVTVRQDSNLTRYAFEDKLVSILWLPTETQIAFVLANKTSNTLKIVWDEAAFVSLSGNSGPVMHEHVKYVDCASAKVPSVVVRAGSLTDVVVPCESVSYSSDWSVKPYLPDPEVTRTNADSVVAGLQAYVGRSVRVLLPIQIESTVNDYIFTFKVQAVGQRAPTELEDLERRLRHLR